MNLVEQHHQLLRTLDYKGVAQFCKDHKMSWHQYCNFKELWKKSFVVPISELENDYVESLNKEQFKDKLTMHLCADIFKWAAIVQDHPEGEACLFKQHNEDLLSAQVEACMLLLNSIKPKKGRIKLKLYIPYELYCADWPQPCVPDHAHGYLGLRYYADNLGINISTTKVDTPHNQAFRLLTK